MHVMEVTIDLLAITVALSALTYWLSPSDQTKRTAVWVGFVSGSVMVWLLAMVGIWAVFIR
jgi:hypothetical protein